MEESTSVDYKSVRAKVTNHHVHFISALDITTLFENNARYVFPASGGLLCRSFLTLSISGTASLKCPLARRVSWH